MSISEQFIQNPDYSTFDLSHSHRTTYDMGQLVPISVTACLPGDKINIGVASFIRGMPTTSPIVDRVDVKINHFFVPYRVLWSKFPDFIAQTQRHLLDTAIAPAMPRVSAPTSPIDSNYPSGRLADYLGVSKYWKNTNKELSAMPWLAYQKVYLDWFVPQRWRHYLMTNGNTHPLISLDKELENVKNSGGGLLGVVGHGLRSWEKLQNVGWNHDYFTNALPTPSMFGDQKIPLFNQGLDPTDQYFDAVNGGTVNTQSDYVVPFRPGAMYDGQSDTADYFNKQKLATIRDLRKSIALQHYLEKLNYSGGRYYETLKVMWNQDIKDETLQMSEYVGGDAFTLFVNEVESTSGTAQNALGDLAGKPIGAGQIDNEFYECDEYGIFITTMHTVPKRSYSDTMDKSVFDTLNVLDFPNPAFEGIGDEAVFQYELTGTNFGTAAQNNVFGYVPRYSRWKTAIDRFSGEMRSSLKHWHLGEDSTTLTTAAAGGISPEFITCNPRTDIFVVGPEPDKMLGTFDIKIKMTRKLQVNPMPGLGRI